MTRPVWIDDLIFRACQRHATEIRLKAGMPPRMYVDGNFVRMRVDALTEETVLSTLKTIMPDDSAQRFEIEGSIQFSFEFGDSFQCLVRAARHNEGVEFLVRPRRIN